MRFTSFLRSIIQTGKATRTIPVKHKPSIVSEVSIMNANSILVLSLILPSRQETCRFHLNLQTATIGQLIDEIYREDAGVERVQIYDEYGKIFSKSYSIHSLLQSSFTIQLNQKRAFLFDPIHRLQTKTDRTIDRKTQDGSTIEDTVATLYHALHIMKVYNERYLTLQREANELAEELEPLEKIKEQLAQISQRYTSRCIWYGLAAMSFQVGILAELTWDVYSWDIVEPISYFVAYGTAMSLYAFHLMTRADFEYMTVTDRLFLRRFYREAHRRSFDISMYNRLKNRLFVVRTDLARLRAPLSLSLPAPPNPFKCKISGEELSPLNFYRTTRPIDPVTKQL